MSTSARAAAMRQSPTYTQAPAQSASIPQLDTSGFGKLPTMPTIDSGRLPDAGAATKHIGDTIGNLPAKFNPQFGQAKAQAKQGLAGLGGWRFKQDDPNTAVDESRELEKDPNAGPGEREIQAVNAERYGANQSGMLHSSFAQKNIGLALQRLSQEAQQVVNQYASNLTSIATQWSTEQAQLTNDWIRSYGEDAKWLAQNPAPRGPDWTESYSKIMGLGAGQASQVRLGVDAPDEAALAQMYPGFSFQTNWKDIGGGDYRFVTDAIKNAPDATPASQGGPVNYAQQNQDNNHFVIGPRSQYDVGERNLNKYKAKAAAQFGVSPNDLQLATRKDGTYILAVKKGAR